MSPEPCLYEQAAPWVGKVGNWIGEVISHFCIPCSPHASDMKYMENISDRVTLLLSLED
jgi:hypothetical protein